MKKKKRRKKLDKDGKVLYKLISNAVQGETMENLRIIIDVKLVSNKKDYLKQAFKPSYMSHEIFENDLITIH